ncbi:MAG: hypothetical protein H7325_02110, partial [Pedobacter sp.]|nr:hypothetical protein [Pedobacter sp.]
LYDCFAIPLATANVPAIGSLTINVLQDNFSEEYDKLWEEATTQFPINCGIKRNAKWLQWKISHHAVFEIRSKSSKSLIGYTAINKKSGLLVDMLARTPEELKAVFQSTLHFLQHSNISRYTLAINKLTGMLTASTEDALSNIPYQKENFTFAFSSSPLQDLNLFEKLTPFNWYMMPND